MREGQNRSRRGPQGLYLSLLEASSVRHSSACAWYSDAFFIAGMEMAQGREGSI
jgi:hypothetical protein